MPEGYSIKWLGWNNENNHDKVWGYIRMDDGRYFAFWGRRGKTLRFKEHASLTSVEKVRVEKELKKNYYWVRPDDYEKLVKDFIAKLETDCMAAILSEKVI